MPKITTRAIDALRLSPGRDILNWYSEIRGFGMRVKPSGTMSYLIQHCKADCRSCRQTVGRLGIFARDQARTLARARLADVSKGGDLAAEKRAGSGVPAVAEVCDWYLEIARTGRILGRTGRPIKASTLALNNSRIETHVKPVLGSHRVRTLAMADLEGFQPDVAVGNTTKLWTGLGGGTTTSGPGVAGRTADVLHTISRDGHFGHAPAGIAQDYIHLYFALVLAADQVSTEFARVLDGQPHAKTQRQRDKTGRPRVGSHAMAG